MGRSGADSTHYAIRDFKAYILSLKARNTSAELVCIIGEERDPTHKLIIRNKET